jgi:hypothetical protein
MLTIALLVVLVVVLAVVWGGLRRGGPHDPEIDARTSRRQMDRQFKKPPNEGGLL